MLRLKFYFYQHFANRFTGVIILGAVACLAGTSLLFWIVAFAAVEETGGALSSMQVALTRRQSVAPSHPVLPPLPSFNSAEVAAQFHENAKAAGLADDEVGYALEAPLGQPYQRYRIRFPVKADYPKIRRFIAGLSADMPYVALDGLRCTRENTTAAELVCDLNFSAFFRLDRNG
jgi:hypothetical protein